MLKLFNSFSLSKEIFEPFEKNNVKIFICGPTVYDYAHLGHARIFLTYDLLCRFLSDQGHTTNVLVNLTDINQNVFNKAKENNKSYREIAVFYASSFLNDIYSLNIKNISRLAYVSDYIKNIEDLISKLIQKQVAYTAHGNVYLDISKAKDYGHISKQTMDELSLHRLDVGPGKKNQEDVMLWNCIDSFDFSWDSKFGHGIPWWHVQDTAVALENFGNRYDIHGGARELTYPHHEAHFAQYRLVSDTDMPVKTWMHVGLVLSGGEKMSKSLGNVVWIKDLVGKYGQNLLRLYLFSTKYRDDIDFNEEDLESKRSLLYMILSTRSRASDKTDKYIENLIENFIESLNDDLNSPLALEKLELICNEVKNGKSVSLSDFGRICNILGLEV